MLIPKNAICRNCGIKKQKSQQPLGQHGHYNWVEHQNIYHEGIFFCGKACHHAWMAKHFGDNPLEVD